SELRRFQAQRDRAAYEASQAERRFAEGQKRADAWKAFDVGSGVAQGLQSQRNAQGSTEKKVRIEFRDARWADVLDWFSKASGLPFIGTQKPTGSVTFSGEYSIPEVIDILNEALLQQKLLLVRRQKSFTLLPADEKIDRSLLPTVTAEALSNYGKT